MDRFNYSALLGLIKERGYTQEQLSNATQICPSQLSLKLNGKAQFKQRDIARIVDVLSIQPCDIGRYFFTPQS